MVWELRSLTRSRAAVGSVCGRVRGWTNTTWDNNVEIEHPLRSCGFDDEKKKKMKYCCIYYFQYILLYLSMSRSWGTSLACRDSSSLVLPSSCTFHLCTRVSVRWSASTRLSTASRSCLRVVLCFSRRWMSSVRTAS